MTEAPPEWAFRQNVLETLRGYRTAQTLITCAELSVFEALADGPCTVTELAAELQATTRGLSLLLDAAVGIGLLEKINERYANTPLAEACLVKDGPYYLGHFVKREGAFYRRWSHLTAAVKTGQRPEENTRDEEPEDWVRDFELALYSLARAIAPLVAEALALPEGRPLRVLDVGGGHGGYSLALARRYPNVTATVFELPRVVPIAHEIVANEGLAERVNVQEGDFQREALGHGYDVALVFGVLNGEAPERRTTLIQKVFNALNPGGRIVVREFLLNADRAGPPEAALFALQMLLATEAGGLSTMDELTDWLYSAGFRPPQTVSLPAWTGSSLIIVAEKP
ncbi:MAG: methyltransferase [Anaerolineales bacterium]